MYFIQEPTRPRGRFWPPPGESRTYGKLRHAHVPLYRLRVAAARVCDLNAYQGRAQRVVSNEGTWSVSSQGDYQKGQRVLTSTDGPRRFRAFPTCRDNDSRCFMFSSPQGDAGGVDDAPALLSQGERRPALRV